mmetsp:Transcript_48480/g.113585  ORF Transcript_48480/g.113585 Transcript_48480/m.113585 type:complete len:411 (-) Transcript_48480:359-1591(-)
MPVRVDVQVFQEADGRRFVRVALAIEASDLGNLFQGNAAAHKHLRGWQVDTCQLLCHWMFDLKPRVQFEKVELVLFGIVEVFHGSSTNVPNILREPLGRPLHLQECFSGNDDRWPFLEDLLEAPLRRAVAAVQGNCIPVLVSHNLNFNVSSSLAKLHHKDGRSRHLVLNLEEAALEILLFLHHSDAFAPSSLRSLDHHRKPNMLHRLLRLLNRGDGSLVEDLLGNGAIRAKVGLQAVTTPRNRWDTRRLCQNIGCDFVPEHRHDRRGGSYKSDSQLLQLHRQFGILRCMTPARPNGIYTLRLGDLHDQIHIGIVVDVLSSRNFDIGICQPNELGICLQILWSCHDNKLEGIVQAKLQVSPLTQGKDGFCGGHAIVCNKPLSQDSLPAQVLDVLLQNLLGVACLGGLLQNS